MKVLVFSESENDIEGLIKSANGGYDLFFSNEQQNCLEKLAVESIDIVILGCDDRSDQAILAFKSFLQAHNHEIPVVCITNEESEEKALELIECGADDVVFRDSVAGELERVLRRVIAKNQSTSQIKSRLRDFILSNSFDGIYALDLDLNILVWNRSMERLFFKKSLDVLGDNVINALPLNGIQAELERAVQGESFAGLRKEFEIRSQVKVYQPYYAPLINSDGGIIGVMGIMRDVTELISKDRLIRELNVRLLSVADTVPQMLWFANRKGERNFFNNRFLEFLGVKSTDLMDEGWLMRVRPDQREPYLNAMKDAAENKKGFHIEYHMRNHENVYRRIMDSCAPITADDGKFLGLMGHCTDMSETGTTLHRIDSLPHARSFSEVASPRRRHRRDQISTTMENAPLGVWKLDKNLEIITVSKSAADQINCSPEELTGKKFTDCIKSISEEALGEILKERTSFQLNAHKVEVKGISKGPPKYFDVAAWPLLDRAKEVIGVCLSTIEVEGRDEDQGREAFVATLVHDLKTPLIGADRTLEMLIDGSMGEVDSGQSEVLSMLQRSNRHLLRMVQNLIEVYRFDFKKTKLDFQDCSMFDLALSCAHELSALAEEKSVLLETNLPSGQGVAEIDELSMKRVIVNLIDNAIKFTPRKGSVKVWGEQTPNMVTLYIKDSGVGIAEDEIPMVFNKFWRSPSASGHAVGTGLGLYLCKQVIDSHNGEIKVEAGLDKGTVVKVSLST